MRVETQYGAVQGTLEKGLVVFRGIPFAASTAGAGRFRPPAPPRPWTGERFAGQFASAPPQTPDPLMSRLGLATRGPVSEDCLHLNVWAPALGRGARPVLVWLHGGAYIHGATDTPVYDGQHLARRGEVVVVTLGYRVGALGFLHLAGLVDAKDFGGDGPSANLGLQDQLAALRWVAENIDRFGGDPRNVTLFGESAGAGSVSCLLAMPGARGLFRRAIIQSAAPRGMLDPDEATSRAEKLLGLLEIPTKQAARLAEVPLPQLLDAQQRCAADGPYPGGTLFAPVVDGEVLPAAPLDAVKAGQAHAVDLLIGTTENELGLYALEGISGPMPDVEMTEALLELVLAAQLPGEVPGGASNARVLIDSYTEARRRRGAGVTPRELFTAIQSDFALRRPATELAEGFAARGRHAYMYLFTRPSPLQNGALGACHALDLPFVFGTLGVPEMMAFAGNDPSARKLSEQMMDAWLAFSRSGNPAHSSVGSWPAYEASRRTTLLLGDVCKCDDAPLEEERAVWDQVRGRW